MVVTPLKDFFVYSLRIPFLALNLFDLTTVRET